MRCRGWLGVLLLAAWPQAAQAQAAADDSLDETQKLGRRLFGNHCVVCHEKPQITSIQYGPSLSRESLGGQQSVIQDVISNGTPRMPGFHARYRGASHLAARK
jgi:mono/diheme cytochrome c family protein